MSGKNAASVLTDSSDPSPALTASGDGLNAAQFTQQVHQICAQLNALDAEIGPLERAVAPLGSTLEALMSAQHPALWLVLGHEGIDRPGAVTPFVSRRTGLPYQAASPGGRSALIYILAGFLLGLLVAGGALWGASAWPGLSQFAW